MHRRDGAEFVHTLRVPYAHTDQMGVVYYANYLVYFEMARTELLRACGLPYAQIEERGVILPVIEAHCVYRQYARYDDLIGIRAWFESMAGTRLTIGYGVYRGETLLASGHTVHACVARDGRAVKPPRELRALVEAHGAGPAPRRPRSA